MYHFRVFLSYAHADRGKVERIDVLLREIGLTPVWDRDIAGGTAFDDGIRRRIAQAHVFMPLLTSNSREQPWVHQEIGYALGIGVAHCSGCTWGPSRRDVIGNTGDLRQGRPVGLAAGHRAGRD
jgi:hypothetical protein